MSFFWSAYIQYRQRSTWTVRDNLIRCLPIGQPWSIYPQDVFLLGSHREYSHQMPSYWSAMEYIPTIYSSIGQHLGTAHYRRRPIYTVHNIPIR
jgi:hypothetical protein